jgi:hypothetical protein
MGFADSSKAAGSCVKQFLIKARFSGLNGLPPASAGGLKAFYKFEPASAGFSSRGFSHQILTSDKSPLCMRLPYSCAQPERVTQWL